MNEVFFTFVPEITMKVLNGILIFYVLVLLALPCLDVPKDVAAVHTEISHGAHSHNHDGDDLCSPFCACSCCVSPIVSPDYVVQISTFQLCRDYNSSYTSTYVSSLFAAIWLPPKIS
jgi:hypothetical protein